MQPVVLTKRLFVGKEVGSWLIESSLYTGHLLATITTTRVGKWHEKAITTSIQGSNWAHL